MNPRRLAIAALVVAALGGGLWWSNKYEAEKEKTGASDTPKVLSIPEDQFSKFEIARLGAEPVVVVRNSAGGWEIQAPRQLPADSASVSGYISLVGSLPSDRLVEEKVEEKGGALAQYGLVKPTIRITVTRKDGKTSVLNVGDDAPTGGASYVQVSGDPRLFTIAASNKTALDKTWQDLRDKRLMTFDSAKLTRVELTAKGQTLEFGKNNSGAWTILKPKPLRADNFAAEELVRKLKDARMETTNDTEEEASWPGKFNSASVVGVAKAVGGSGSQEIEVRKDKDGAYFAKSSAVPGIFKVGNELGEELAKSLADFRNKKLFDFGFNEPARVSVKHEGTTYVFTKSGADWKRDGKTMDSGLVQQVIDKLRDLTAIGFAEPASGAPLAEYAIAMPDGKGSETVSVVKQGNRYLATRANEVEVLELDGKVVDEIRSTAASVKEPAKQDQKK